MCLLCTPANVLCSTWLVNTGLTPLDPEETKGKSTAKMTKSLQDAYRIASEGHDLDHFKKVLMDFEEERARIAAEIAAAEEEAEAQKAAKAEKDAADAAAEPKEKKKKARKSKAADDEDVEMEDADAAPKSSKKRKKDADSDGEGDKVSKIARAQCLTQCANASQSKKTPKIKKLNAPKTPNGETPAKKASTSKPKKKVAAPPKEEEAAEEKKELTEAERLEQREKAILYLRHRLQKGFLTRDVEPKEEEMAAMADFFSQLEKYENLEPAIIRTTKIHKVLKAIVKLAAIPKDDEFGFKKRSIQMLEIWNKRMEADGETAPKAAAVEEKAPETNGDAVAPASETPAAAEETKEGAEQAEEKAEEIEAKIEKPQAEEKPAEPAAEEAKVDTTEPPAAPVEKTDPGNEAQDEAADGDVSMMTAPEEPAAASAEA